MIWNNIQQYLNNENGQKITPKVCKDILEWYNNNINDSTSRWEITISFNACTFVEKWNECKHGSTIGSIL